MKKKYLKFYKECMKTGRMPHSGLCMHFDGDPLFDLFSIDQPCFRYWAYDGEPIPLMFVDYAKYKFTPFRQTIVLLMAAMNNEL
jgi:hypothetical protein